MPSPMTLFSTDLPTTPSQVDLWCALRVVDEVVEFFGSCGVFADHHYFLVATVDIANGVVPALRVPFGDDLAATPIIILLALIGARVGFRIDPLAVCVIRPCASYVYVWV